MQCVIMALKRHNLLVIQMISYVILLIAFFVKKKLRIQQPVTAGAQTIFQLFKTSCMQFYSLFYNDRPNSF